METQPTRIEQTKQATKKAEQDARFAMRAIGMKQAAQLIIEQATYVLTWCVLEDDERQALTNLVGAANETTTCLPITL